MSKKQVRSKYSVCDRSAPAAHRQRTRSAPAAHPQRTRKSDGTNILTPGNELHNENPSLVALGNLNARTRERSSLSQSTPPYQDRVNLVLCRYVAYIRTSTIDPSILFSCS